MSDQPEEWRPIPGYEGLYEVSDRGRVRSLDRTIQRNGRSHRIRGVVLAQSSTGPGYRHVSLRSGGRAFTQLVHRAVLLAFVGPCPTGMESRHLDGEPDNNVPSNLAWGTHSENNRDRVRHGTHHHAIKTHCIHNHLLKDAYITPTGGRSCRTCRRIWARAADARRKEKHA